MSTNKVTPYLDPQCTQAWITKAHMVLGSCARDVEIPRTTLLRKPNERPYFGALRGLNDQRFATLGSRLRLSKLGLIINQELQGDVLTIKTGIPVYSEIHVTYQDMLFVDLAIPGRKNKLSKIYVEVDPKAWEIAKEGHGFYWLDEVKVVDPEPNRNPFDYAQARLPKTMQLGRAAQEIQTATLCRFYSDIFRFLNPEDRALFNQIMLQKTRFSKFINFAASTRNHHNQEYGLFVHTAETAANILLSALAAPAERGANVKPKFDLSLTLLAALLHDAAKVEEYHRLAPGVYSTNLNCALLGHEQTMLKWIAVACSQIRAYPPQRELELEHSICAVKKQDDQSGVRKRKTLMSFVLHEADSMSAKSYTKGETSVLLAQKHVRGISA